jgi:hypothetical protein
MPSRSWSGSSNGRKARRSSRPTATLLTIARPSGYGSSASRISPFDDAGAVVLSRADVIDADGGRSPEHAYGRGPVGWRPEGVRTDELHRTVPPTGRTCMRPSVKVDLVPALGLKSVRRAWRCGGIEISGGRGTHSDDQAGGPARSLLAECRGTVHEPVAAPVVFEHRGCGCPG